VIHIEKISIEKFRGIRELTLDLHRETFGICGPNGTGKSGIVDAIEFGLTGDISRLSGRGTGDLSVKAHGPHVKERTQPKQAKVAITAYIPSLDKSAVITRTVESPSTYQIKPDTPEIRAVIDEIRIHPEFALSRREIIQYILSEPGKRSTDVQELLRLADVEQTRKALTTIANDARRDYDAAQQGLVKARADLLQIMGVDKPDPTLIISVVNEKRAVLSLPPLSKLEANTSFKEGVPAAAKAAEAPVNKAQATADIKCAAQTGANGEDAETAKSRAAALKTMKNLVEDTATFRTLKQQALVTAGMSLVDEDACPLCDEHWDREELHKHLAAKLQSAQAATQLLSSLRTNLNSVIGRLDASSALLGRIASASAKLSLANAATLERKGSLEAAAKAMRDFASKTDSIDGAKDALSLHWWEIPAGVEVEMNACVAALKALPEISDEDKARDFLTLAEERYSKATDARSESDACKKRSDVATKVLQTFQSKKDEILETLYQEVAKDFTAYYRSLNQEDEGEFVGKLVPSAAKLGFDVDFYGYGKFPPGAYHSEGHQDGMGLCLYLALMKRTLGDKFTFAVLDDVMMSIDADHRRSVCKLLKKEFPKTQFILTTHDRVWLKFMHTEGLIKDSQTFSSWTVESGPRVWKYKEIWTAINEALEKDDIEGAAATLRHFLEYISTVLADAFRAEVRFKGDGQYTLEDLMPSVLNRWRGKISDAIKVAKSWDKDAEVVRLTELLARIDDAHKRTNAERWAINPAVHYNTWANIQAKEFKPVVQAFSDILATMRCNTCNSYAEFQPRHATAETIRCTCGDFFINLNKKPAAT
jgi:hypothetical protein